MLASPDRGRLPDSPDNACEYKYSSWYRAVWGTGGTRTRAPCPPGDVLVWTDKGGSSNGHVAVVTAVNKTKRAISYIGGNEWIAGNRDSIVRHSGYWSKMPASMSGKTFRGFASRF